MGPRSLILILLVLLAVLGIYMGGNPEHAERMAQASREAQFTGETRQLVLLALALGLGGFIVYLTMTRR
jgi:lipopolysaccharide export system protein LptC